MTYYQQYLSLQHVENKQKLASVGLQQSSNGESYLFDPIVSTIMPTPFAWVVFHTPSVSKQKLRLDIICITKQKVRLVKFLSNFIKRTGMLP
jgi:hypothetical protein